MIKHEASKALLPAVIFLALGVTGCASTPDNGLNEVEVRTQRLSAIASIEEPREVIKLQLKDKELAWFATEKMRLPMRPGTVLKSNTKWFRFLLSE